MTFDGHSSHCQVIAARGDSITLSYCSQHHLQQLSSHLPHASEAPDHTMLCMVVCTFCKTSSYTMTVAGTVDGPSPYLHHCLKPLPEPGHLAYHQTEPAWHTLSVRVCCCRVFKPLQQLGVLPTPTAVMGQDAMPAGVPAMLKQAGLLSLLTLLLMKPERELFSAGEAQQLWKEAHTGLLKGLDAAYSCVSGSRLGHNH